MESLTILFGRPYADQSLDDRFELEALAAEEVGLEYYAIPLEPVVNGDARRALRKLPRPAGRTWLFRGWMLTEEEYADLYEEMERRDEQLVVNPEEFAEAMYAPNWIPLLGRHTPESRWTEGDDIDEAWELALELGSPPWILKDHVKSVKELWYTACYVPVGADRDTFREFCERLREARGDRFERGFVIRRALELATLPGFTAERRRVPDEHRLIFWNGRFVAQAPYYDVEAEGPEPASFAFLGRRLASPFFTADVARLTNGDWTVIEINDGSCSSLPEQLDPRDLYRAILD